MSIAIRDHMNNKTFWLWLFLGCSLAFSAAGAVATESIPASLAEQVVVPNNLPIIEPKPFSGSVPSLLSSREFFLALVSIFFGLVILIIEYRLLSKSYSSGDQILKVLVVTTIIIATMFIITAGYSSAQIAPAIGLFGTIAGYLLGRTEKNDIKDRISQKRVKDV